MSNLGDYLAPIVTQSQLPPMSNKYAGYVELRTVELSIYGGYHNVSNQVEELIDILTLYCEEIVEKQDYSGPGGTQVIHFLTERKPKIVAIFGIKKEIKTRIYELEERFTALNLVLSNKRKELEALNNLLLNQQNTILELQARIPVPVSQLNIDPLLPPTPAVEITPAPSQ